VICDSESAEEKVFVVYIKVLRPEDWRH
jgi:hypothetical protein